MVLKIVTSIYELNYEEGRGGMVYKSFPLLTQTIRNILFDNFEYVIYTDKKTYDKHHLDHYFKRNNVTIKFHELNDDFYVENIEPTRKYKYDQGEIWDRIYCVKNYSEVIHNKLKFLLLESENFEGNVVWIDSGLFGTSCHDGWRDYINDIAHSELFLNKINEKIIDHKFIALNGSGVLINYEFSDRFRNCFGVNPFVVSGGLFGGKPKVVKSLLNDYNSYLLKMIEINNELFSEQELMSILLENKENVKFFEYGDWLDFQKPILEIMDLLDLSKYKTEKCYDRI